MAALRQNGRRPLAVPALALCLALPGAAFLDRTLAALLPMIVLAIAASLVAAMLRTSLDGVLSDWAATMAGALYIALLISYFVALRERASGLQWLLMAFLCTWACDSFALLAGRAFGRRPFAPRISPRKTWEGTVGGLAAGTLAGLLAGPLLGLPWAAGLLLGALVAVAAVAGDLAESFIKRQLGIKDFSALIPGHGGVLDRIDSLLFTVPLVYYIAILFGGS